MTPAEYRNLPVVKIGASRYVSFRYGPYIDVPFSYRIISRYKGMTAVNVAYGTLTIGLN